MLLCKSLALLDRKKREQYEEFLKTVKIFSTIETYELTKIMDAVKQVEYPAGAEIIKEVIKELNLIGRGRQRFLLT